MCGEGCLMARGVVRDARDATLPGRLRRMRRKRQRPLRPTSMLVFALSWPSFCSNPLFPCPGVDSMGRSRCEGPFRTGWRVGQRRAGRCGGWVLARGRVSYVWHILRALAVLPVLPRMDVLRLYRLQAPREFFALTPRPRALSTSKSSACRKKSLRTPRIYHVGKREALQLLIRDHAHDSEALRDRRGGCDGQCRCSRN